MSQDDDGWEGGNPQASTAQTRESTVVVDPVSQIPEPIPSFRREPVEKTEVLQGRRIDQLRAEVHRKRKDQQRRQHQRLALWGAAGAGAVLLGALLAGLVFSGPQTASEERDVEFQAASALSLRQAESSAAESSAAAATTMKSQPQSAEAANDGEATTEPPRAKPSQELAAGALSLDDLPSE